MGEDKQEMLEAVASHYGMPALMSLVDEIVERIGREVMTVPLPQSDPEKAALALYSKRMQAEGATALRNALHNKVQALKSKVRESKQ